jgi:hypothetical protein
MMPKIQMKRNWRGIARREARELFLSLYLDYQCTHKDHSTRKQEGSRKEAGRKQEGSRKEAGRKQAGSRKEAGRKQEGSRKEGSRSDGAEDYSSRPNVSDE